MTQVPAAQESLQANYEELFDVVACYFPISFTPPPNNVHGITREDLAGALQTTLTCTPLFTPLFIPMLVEKLSSTLRSGSTVLAKLPSIKGSCQGAPSVLIVDLKGRRGEGGVCYPQSSFLLVKLGKPCLQTCGCTVL